MKVTSAFAQYPTKQYAETKLMTYPLIASKFKNGTHNYETIKQTVLRLNIFYDDLSYTLYSESPKMVVLSF